MQEPHSYRSLIADIRESARSYIAKLLLLPRQEIGELVRANVRAALWIAAGAGVLGLGLIAFVVLLIELVALVVPAWLAALLLMLGLGILGGLLVWMGARRLVLRGPERTIRSVKETISWVKATLLGRSAS